MGFPSGPVSFQRFEVVGPAPAAPDDDLLARLHDARFQETQYGTPDELEAGWCGPRHLFDAAFSLENCAFAECLFFGLRLDTNRVPAEVKRAMLFEEEPPAGGKTDGRRRASSREAAKARIDQMLRDGRFRRSRRIAVLWDLSGGCVYAAAAGAVRGRLMELFEKTFGVSLRQLTAGRLAERIVQSHGRGRDLEDMRPARFVHGPEGPGQWPDYPWVARQADSAVSHTRDHLGNEFLLWLWHAAADGGGVKTADGEVSLVVSQTIDLQCAYGVSGRDSLRSDAVAAMPEAMEGLRSGKVPRKLGLILESGGQYELALSAETLAVSAAKLPEVEEAETPRVLFEERIGLLRNLAKTLDALFASFLKVRTGSWDSQLRSIRKWIGQAEK